MTTPATRGARTPITHPRDAILSTADVCAVLGVTHETVAKMDLPCFYAGNRPRYIWGQVLDVLASRAIPDAKPAGRRRVG